MAMTDDEHDSISALVVESEATAEIARQLAEFLQADHQSVERMRAVRTGIGSEIIEIPYKQNAG